MDLDFEWDEKKRRSNLDKHGIDFEDAIGIFEGCVFVRRSDRDDEARFVAVGEIEGRIIALVYTIRGAAYRIISARRASNDEARHYHDRKAAPGG
jgi:uncharacterized DUF497 family protein